ncbi:hypothetical protein KY290_023920 [Solanum tuberosum]|uniref:FBD domain-containing protein n=1 Tax=Solanum tuberosum TaxID=4113 RepID=A0ABQ7UP75_SOLTU|nr:hypothetical protein KY290_023920 [Solanum tuberosum]
MKLQIVHFTPWKLNYGSWSLQFLPTPPLRRQIDQSASHSSSLVYGYLDGDYDEPVPQDAVDDIPASFLDMTLNNLRTVKIYGVTGAAAEMQLIKVLLAKSPTLVRMVIRPCVMEDKESFKVLAEITKFPRASSKAEVVYSVD